MADAHINTRLEAFCDAVFAIAITLLVIDVRIPATAEIKSTMDLWNALRDISPSIFAFLLSFGVVLITWVNHHNHLQLISKSTGSFLYANGFLLLTVAFIPFPTSLLGDYLLTDHAAPAVILYDFVLALQAIGWVLISQTAFSNQLGKSEKANRQILTNGKFGYYAFALYTGCTILAIWFPFAIACFTTLTWIFWLLFGINIRRETNS